jgi:hypothetical protein
VITKTQAKILQVPAALEGITFLKDGGLSVRFQTKELNEEEKVNASKWYQQYGWLTFAANDQVEVPSKDAPRDEFSKTPSQRLRNTIYVLYQQSGQAELTFDEFYRRKIEQFINYVKQDLRD